MNILAGYEIRTGTPVTIPAAHMAITGQTQRSGKTTAMESIVERSGMKAVAFITKRGESAFQFGHEIQPYFRERADWKFVKELFEQLTSSSQNDKEAEIIRLCDGAKSLEHVWQRVRKAMEGRHSKRKDDMYIRINAYFEDIMPRLMAIPRSKRLELRRGINVIDMREYEHSVQEILIQNAFQWVYEKEENVIFVVPEAWDFLSEDHGSITRTAGREFIRRAAALHNFLWADCQDIRGLDKVILGMMGVWLVGNQREMNEMARTIKSFPSLPAPPSVTEIMTLGIGEFFVLHGTESRKVYVQPVWADAHACAIYAKNRDADGKPRMPLPKMPPPPKRPRTELIVEVTNAPQEKENTESDVREDRILDASGDSGRASGGGDQHSGGQDSARGTDSGQARPSETEQLRAEIKEIRRMVEALAKLVASSQSGRHDLTPKGQELLRDEEARSTFTVGQGNGGTMGKAETKPAKDFNAGDEAQYEAIYQWIRDRARRDPELLTLLVSKPELRIQVERPVLEANGNSLRGALGMLITKGFFKSPAKGQAAYEELMRMGRNPSKPNVYRECDALAALGFLTKEADGYQSVPDMKIRTVEA